MSYRRSQMYLEMQNMHSHYRRLREVKPCIDMSSITQSLKVIRYRKPSARKYAVERSIKVEDDNVILRKHLLRIRNSEGASFDTGSIQTNKKNMKEKRRKEISRLLLVYRGNAERDHANILLKYKLINAAPEVSTKQQLKQDHKMHKRYLKNLRRSCKSQAPSRLSKTIQVFEKQQIQTRPSTTRGRRSYSSGGKRFQQAKRLNLQSARERYREEEDDHQVKELKRKPRHQIF